MWDRIMRDNGNMYAILEFVKYSCIRPQHCCNGTRIKGRAKDKEPCKYYIGGKCTHAKHPFAGR
jgi:hypothetical protein